MTGRPAVLLAVLALAATACGGPDAQSLIDGASETLEAAGTSRFEMIEQSDPAVREQLRTYAEATGLPDAYPMELWIDDDGLVRRIRTLVDAPTPGGAGDGVTQQTTLELYDFGVDVDLDPPLDDETVELRDLIAELEELERLESELPDDAG